MGRVEPFSGRFCDEFLVFLFPEGISPFRVVALEDTKNSGVYDLYHLRPIAGNTEIDFFFSPYEHTLYGVINGEKAFFEYERSASADTIPHLAGSRSSEELLSKIKRGQGVPRYERFLGLLRVRVKKLRVVLATILGVVSYIMGVDDVSLLRRVYFSLWATTVALRGETLPHPERMSALLRRK